MRNSISKPSQNTEINTPRPNEAGKNGSKLRSPHDERIKDMLPFSSISVKTLNMNNMENEEKVDSDSTECSPNLEQKNSKGSGKKEGNSKSLIRTTRKSPKSSRTKYSVQTKKMKMSNHKIQPNLDSRASKNSVKTKWYHGKRKYFILFFILLVVITLVMIATAVFRENSTTLFGPTKNGFFGKSISLSFDGSKIAIGGRGTVHLYNTTNSKNHWNLETDLSLYVSNDFFGGFGNVVLSPDGLNLIISDMHADDNRGNVRVFSKRDNSQWLQVGDTLTGDFENDSFGTGVGISNDGLRIVVTMNLGLVTVYDLVDSNWVTIKQFSDGDTACLSSNGDILSIAGLDERGVGSIRIYDLNTFSLIDEINGEQNFGGNMICSNDGSTIAARKSNAIVVVYRRDPISGKFSDPGREIIGPLYSDFGSSMSLSDDGNTIIIGGSAHGGMRFSRRGTSILYKMENNFWKKAKTIVGKKKTNQNGWAVALSGDAHQAAVGSPGDDEKGDNVGAVRIHDIR